MLKIGLDIGSTTAKLVAIDEKGEICFSLYGRHNAQVNSTIKSFLGKLAERFGNAGVAVNVTGSVGMGITERHGFPFVQEVVAASKAIQHCYGSTCTMIDIGGETPMCR